ncbi:MAG: hypothetical protein IKH91_12270 [Prevotella sp.]|nr:hypothetical protein [Prevotella sp.]
MGRTISLFADYHGSENSVTNYCGLMLKLVYQESPKLLFQLLDTLFEGEVEVPFVGPTFEQQNAKRKTKSHSIPDLEIKQESFQILVETKLDDWFYKNQLENHIAGFSDKVASKILILLCNFEDKNFNQVRQNFKKEMKEKGISVLEVTFEDLLKGLSEVCKTPQLQEYLSEFEDYLDRKELLPTWKYRLDVVNCGITKNEILQDNIYMCPNRGGQYRHQRARYFGTYWERNVEYIYHIDAIVAFDVNFHSYEMKWKNDIKEDDKELLKRAKEAIKKYRIDEIRQNGIQVFLLSDPRKVDFKKDTKGGLYGSKKYFMINDAKDIDSCAKLIKERKWSDIESK